MKKKYRVKKNQEFQEILDYKHKYYTKNLMIYYKPNKSNNPRFGISVGKKIGKAFLRNKYKRQIRMIIINYLKKDNLKKNNDYIIILKKNVCDLSYNELEEQINMSLHLIERKDS